MKLLTRWFAGCDADAAYLDKVTQEAGVTSELIVKKGGGHDAGLVREHMPRAVEWFDRHLARKGEPEKAQ